MIYVPLPFQIHNGVLAGTQLMKQGSAGGKEGHNSAVSSGVTSSPFQPRWPHALQPGRVEESHPLGYFQAGSSST